MSALTLSAILVAGAVLPVCWLAVGAVRALLRRHAVLDVPNERSSHVAPTPRGGGIAVVGLLLIAWLVLWLVNGPSTDFPLFWLLLGAAALLGLISWLDDKRGGLHPLHRLAVQACAVAAGLFALPDSASVFQGTLPIALDMALSGLLWLWFVNLFNFMDGIDGISGSQAGTGGLGVFAIALLAPEAAGLGGYGLSLAAVAVAFLLWNWQPAKIFLGDVGRVPLGYLIGWLLLSLSAHGLWQAAVLLAAYYLADATITLVRRALRRERLWHPHREHFYQHAVRAGRSHAAVVAVITGVNLLLLGLALATLISVDSGWAALGLGAVLTAGLLWYLRRPRKSTSHVR